jgi:hypothetical protein
VLALQMIVERDGHDGRTCPRLKIFREEQWGVER